MVVAPTVAAVLLGVVLVAGAVNGVAGFGFALVGTTVLATVIDPSVAVVFMIAPILAVNVSLVRDLSRAELRTCARRFRVLVAAAAVGTVLGMLALDWLPARPLKAGLGLLTLSFVATSQDVVSLPGRESVEERCFVESGPAMAGVGAVSGLLFGGTNVGVQLIAYLRSCDLSHGTFVGVVAMTFLGLNAVRIGLAGALGLYPSAAVAGASLLAALPALGGVAVGKRLRERVGERQRRVAVLALLTVVGVRLLVGAAGIA